MSADVFERTVSRTLDELPAQFRDLLENVEILIEGEHWDEPDLYGLYEGIPLTERSSGSTDFQQPDRVYVFRRPLTEDFGHDAATLTHEIRVTLLHELAHFFGIGEDRLSELGWA
ncbi:MAG: metallopeptidase family protein [Thermoleophilia bacterium]|nr:metallopeptidase family protein [Thermoleophilia bacterium]MCZ4496492.1 metallopeptidase family protein [Thermoleophilia bacterium]